MTKKIIVLVGLLSSGKGTVAKYFVEKYGAQSFRFSTIMRDVLDRLYLEHSRENMSNLSTLLRERFGEDLFAKVMAADVAKSDAKIVVVDGARRQADVEHLKKIAGFKLVSIEADPKIRYERLTRRAENPDDKNKTWEQFLADHQLETEVNIPPLMKLADVVVDNNGSAEELYRQLDNLLK
ncbi:MAG: hypothetical protein C3F02_00695 [Parcubacteria group bacterium]|nr:MAG: hypothetical protein C3F02_00695 [Parcubacteria group bacterium]